jgi:uncharacterized membrane protein YeaQ/YmgE (transglycosylase-associated protein family)
MMPVYQDAKVGPGQDGGIAMFIPVWLIPGLGAGWIASLMLGRGGYGLIGNTIVGMIDVIVGLSLSSMLLDVDVSGLNITSLLLTLPGTILVIIVFRALTEPRQYA